MWDLQKMACSYRPSQQASGGLLIAWDLAEVEVWSTVSFEHVLAIHGRFLKTNEEFHVLNVYCNARFELFYLFNYLIEFRVFLNNLFDLW